MRSTFVSGVALTVGLLAGAFLPVAQAQVRQAQEMVARAPGSAVAWSELGAAYRVEGMLGESSRALRESLRREPASVRTWYELGRTAWARGDDDAVQAIYQKVRQLNPQAASEYRDELLNAAQAGAAQSRPVMVRTMAAAPVQTAIADTAPAPAAVASPVPVNVPAPMPVAAAPTQVTAAARPGPGTASVATPASAAPPPNSRLTGSGGWECLTGFVMYEERRCIPLLNR